MGLGFFGVLTLLFIALKLTGYIDWSWIYVLLPLIVSVIVIVGLILLAILAKWMDS